MTDWSVHLLQLAARGELGRARKRILLDLPALAQPFACDPRLCTPGLRTADARSCCADLEVTLTLDERAAIEASLPAIAVEMGWTKAPALFDGDALTRPGRRCVFARDDVGPDGSRLGLRCGLHALEDRRGLARGALKPLPCRLFPLVLVDAEQGRTLVTAIHKRTANLAQSRPARAFPCIGARAPTLAESCAPTLTELYGAAVSREVLRVVRQWVSSTEHR